jgi:RimJ/RimL family protein N-acetyltransferase
MMTHPEFLEGQLITLERLKPSHLTWLEKIANEPAIWQNLPIEGWRNDVFWTWAYAALEAQLKNTAFPFVIFENRTGQLIGTTRFQDMDRAHRKTDIGWTWFTPSVWGGGFNIEAKQLMLTQAFEFWQVLRVGFKVDERNRRSQRALEKLGASQEGYIRKHLIRPDGSSRNSILYGITNDDWFGGAKKYVQSLVIDALVAHANSFGKNETPKASELLNLAYTSIQH